jgi:hypothetical protein
MAHAMFVACTIGNTAERLLHMTAIGGKKTMCPKKS